MHQRREGLPRLAVPLLDERKDGILGFWEITLVVYRDHPRDTGSEPSREEPYRGRHSGLCALQSQKALLNLQLGGLEGFKPHLKVATGKATFLWVVLRFLICGFQLGNRMVERDR